MGPVWHVWEKGWCFYMKGENGSRIQNDIARLLTVSPLWVFAMLVFYKLVKRRLVEVYHWNSGKELQSRVSLLVTVGTLQVDWGKNGRLVRMCFFLLRDKGSYTSLLYGNVTVTILQKVIFGISQQYSPVTHSCQWNNNETLWALQ